MQPETDQPIECSTNQYQVGQQQNKHSLAKQVAPPNLESMAQSFIHRIRRHHVPRKSQYQRLASIYREADD